MPLDSQLIVHPLDASALRTLKAVPGFDSLVAAVMKNFYERAVHVNNMSNNIRLGEKQIPEIYNLLPPICQTLGIKIPGLFLELNPWPNAYTTGNDECCVVLTSGLLELLELDEIKAVIAHECGHVFHRHCLYHMLGDIIGTGMSFLSYIPFAKETMSVALYGWSRMSEFSADRISALVMGSPQKMNSALGKLAGGLGFRSRYKIEHDEIKRQAADFRTMSQQTDYAAWENWSVMWRSHPLYVRRIQELTGWCDTSTFGVLIRRLVDEGELKGFVCKTEGCGKVLAKGTKFCPNCHRPPV